VAATPVPHLERALRAAEEAGADLAIIDTAGRANDTASAAARAADLILIPLQPSLPDLNTVAATLDVIRLAGGKPTRALLARVKAAGNRHAETTTWLAAKGVEVCPVTLGERVIFQDAYAMGLGVSEAEPTGKAAEEIQHLYKYTCSILGIPTTGKGEDEKAKRSSKRVA
jgi:chromosome partitioning protein